MAKREGIKLLGIVDFDVIDGVEEFLDACELLGVRGSAGMETRVFIPQLSSREINSPGEPGISYHMGIGFTSNYLPPVGAAILDDMRTRADQRNRAMVERLNWYLSPLTLDYDKDVLPLTPSGNATERHILGALYIKSFGKIHKPIAFWAEKLSMDIEQVRTIINDAPGFQNIIRKKLMKQGGVGYVQPGSDTFPVVDDVHRLIVSGGAIPCITWLDGTSEGEKDIEELFGLMIEKGAGAVNIVPDRNWNISDPIVKKAKLENLYKIVALAEQYALPLNVGTEMNAYGLKFVDSFNASELMPVRDAFVRGAYFIYGHTIMQRYAGMGYQSDWATMQLGDRAAKKEFFTMIGEKIESAAAKEQILGVKASWSSQEVLDSIDSFSDKRRKNG
jgi:hypothetical protein